jgi:formylglycine-generating enzyme required for sulfatase activity
LVDVFISYPRVERSKVELIKAKLDALGLDTFFDIHGIDGGDTFPDVIDHALKSAKAVLGVWSPRAFQSKWCMIECRVGAARGVLVPIAVERFSELDMKSDFMTTNYLDLTDFDGRENHEGWQRTLRSLSRHVGRELAHATPAVPKLKRLTPTPLTVTPLATPTPPAPLKNLPFPDSAIPEMVRIPPGRFLMGSPSTEERWKEYDGREEPQHEVRIDYAFALGKHAVTFAEWDAAIAAGAELISPSDEGWGRDRRPVINVNWNDAKAYIAWLNSELGLGRTVGYRLPSEAEWEYACRAGTSTPFSFGDTISTSQANYDGNHTYGAGKKGEHREKTTSVGSFPANAFGLHDMHGNVWEWCEDVWNANYIGAPADGSRWSTGDTSCRVVRGGSWNDSPEGLRSALRVRYVPTTRYANNGFRVARTL